MISKFINREVSDFAFSDEWLGGSMLFIAGPRQCGKTTLSRMLVSDYQYINYDLAEHRLLLPEMSCPSVSGGRSVSPGAVSRTARRGA